jgi:2-polyprenyl-6-methoxyphenol hydroxylase-like FAD-dependent oxidoreductase
MERNDRSVAVVGAGIGGLAAALALRSAGFSVRVYEREVHPRELGLALLLAPNAMSALRELSLADAIVTAGAAARRGEVRRLDGKTLRRIDSTMVTERLGEPAIVALRPVLHGALLEAVGEEALVLGRRATGCTASEAGATVHFEGGENVRARIVVGADGVGSAIRNALHPTDTPPQPSGLFALRGVAHGVGHHLGELSGAQYFGRGIEAGVVKANSEAVYWYLSVPAAALKGKSQAPRELLEQLVTGSHAPLQAIVTATRPEDVRLDELFERAPLPQWGRGAVTLLGDAAHPMLPHAGQGAAQALEDAVTLARALRAERPLEASLRRYEKVRSGRTSTVVRVAKRNAQLGSVSSALGCWLRDTALTLVPSGLILRHLVSMGRPPPVEE